MVALIWCFQLRRGSRDLRCGIQLMMYGIKEPDAMLDFGVALGPAVTCVPCG